MISDHISRHLQVLDFSLIEGWEWGCIASRSMADAEFINNKL